MIHDRGPVDRVCEGRSPVAALPPRPLMLDDAQLADRPIHRPPARRSVPSCMVRRPTARRPIVSAPDGDRTDCGRTQRKREQAGGGTGFRLDRLLRAPLAAPCLSGSSDGRSAGSCRGPDEPILMVQSHSTVSMPAKAGIRVLSEPSTGLMRLPIFDSLPNCPSSTVCVPCLRTPSLDTVSSHRGRDRTSPKEVGHGRSLPGLSCLAALASRACGGADRDSRCPRHWKGESESIVLGRGNEHHAGPGRPSRGFPPSRSR